MALMLQILPNDFGHLLWTYGLTQGYQVTHTLKTFLLSLIMFSLNILDNPHVIPLAFHMDFCWYLPGRGGYSETLILFEFHLIEDSSMLKTCIIRW